MAFDGAPFDYAPFDYAQGRLHSTSADPLVIDARAKQQIGQPIDVREDHRVDRVDAKQDNATLGTTTNGPGEMKHRPCRRAAGQNELAKRRELGVKPINPRFQLPYRPFVEIHFGDSTVNPGRWIRQPSPSS